MAVVVIARGPWSIETTSITNTIRTTDSTYNVVVVTSLGVSYALTVAEAITLGVTIPQVPPVMPNSAVGSFLPNTNIGVLGVNSTSGKLVVMAWGAATSSAGIIAEIGAAALYADGSIYLSTVGGAGLMFNKVNGVWVANNTGGGALVYDALLTQAAGAAPVATVLLNTLSAAIVWARTSAGLYTGTLVAAFTAAKTQIFIGSNAAALPATTFNVIQSQRTSADVVTIQTSLVTLSAGPPPTGVATDSLLSETAIRIVVFP